ncbi:hypothetical protein DOO78_24845 [Roseicella frigidaeris]|uniref:Uncharacterized protein n=1 Tax=Roseicella frigidaeris TaxID=2230885 RepID=A0A327M539_9PROT|nr:hypothetical protein DOO78_24845 [Roseicella frigidaeris]
MSITTLPLGRRLANREAEGRKIGAFEGVPAMGLDGLGSASHGPEAMLAVLAVVGAAGLGWCSRSPGPSCGTGAPIVIKRRLALGGWAWGRGRSSRRSRAPRSARGSG